jgi:hypothetical protein
MFLAKFLWVIYLNLESDQFDFSFLYSVKHSFEILGRKLMYNVQAMK